jgi:PncC family amidohydrolase
MEGCNKELIFHAEKTAEALIDKLKTLSLKLALAESCTAGLVSSLLGNIPGASAVLWGSFVCYAREAKVSMLGIDNNKLLAHGLVNRETVRAMADGALKKSGADVSAAVTGLAGPQGDGSKTKVGTVWVAAARRGGVTVEREFFFEGGAGELPAETARNEIRLKAAIAVLETTLNLAACDI